MCKKKTGKINNPKEKKKNIAQKLYIEKAVMIAGIYAILAVIAVYVQYFKIDIVFKNVTSYMQYFLPNESTTIMIAIVSAAGLSMIISFLYNMSIINLIFMNLLNLLDIGML